jgi:poly-gamma-glutamate capsule biosynthesis protein CapA/YwtB (metallophosphatase superfamily)
MPDYKRTQKLYEEQGVSKFYKKPPEQQDDERFYLQVTNPDTGTFYKLSDLPVAYRKFGEERTYPNKTSQPNNQDKKVGWYRVAKE